MTEYKDKMAMLVLSCDKYSDVWDDFFYLKERFWPECPFDWYVVTESLDYKRDHVSTIKCGKELNWAGRFRKAVQTVNTPYIGLYLEDYFIKAPIDTARILSFLDLMEKDKVSFLNLGNVFHHIVHLPNPEYYVEHLIKIPQHLRYGIDTAAAIWDKEYLLEKLGTEDYSAWKFESDRCEEAASEKGLGGLLLCDDQLSFNVSEIPVVIQGVLYPEAVKFFKDKVGYEIQSKRSVMSRKDVMKYKFKTKMCHAKYGRKFLKWVGTHVMGYKFFTED